MRAFIDRNHTAIYSFLGIVGIVLAFYVGFLEGNRENMVQPVVLSCKEDVLDKLSIPLASLADPATAHAQGLPSTTPAGMYVGSKNGTKYYLPTCSQAKRIKPANYIWFSSAQDAQIQGYTQGKC